MSEHNYTPLLPFEDTIRDNFIIYNNTTYVRDIDLTEQKYTDKPNDNMIKYYSIKINDTIKIGGD